MKKRVIVLIFVLLFTIPSIAFAATPKTGSVIPKLSFSGTTATCQATVLEDSPYSYIVVTMKLWSGNQCLHTWTKADTETVMLKETATVTKGQTYRLTVDIMVNGTSRPQYSITRTC